jgi:molybdate transport system substrate-binding protein
MRSRYHLTVRSALALGLVAVLAAFASSALAGSRAPQRSTAQITVFAAASLSDVFPKIDSGPKYSFAASNTLAQQIRQGAPADVFATADMLNPQALHSGGQCSKPTVFATNKLVVVYPNSNPGKVKTVFDLRRPGVKVVIARQGVPVGNYTRQILRNLGITSAVLSNVVSQEPDVRSVLAKVALGEADAGFVYITDAATVKDQVSVIRLPAWAQSPVRYGICVVSSSPNKTDAQAFVNKVLGPAGRAQLVAAGFGVPRARK